MVAHCRHEWKERSQALRAAFGPGSGREEHLFYVCARCLRIRELDPTRVRLAPEPSGLDRLLAA